MVNESTLSSLVWRHYTAPTSEELAELMREAQVNATDALALSQTGHRPEVVARSQYIAVFCNAPVFQKKLRVTSGASFYAVASEMKLWTIQFEPIASFARIQEEVEKTPAKLLEQTNGTALGLLLYFLQAMNEGTFRKLERLAKHVDIAEYAVFQGNERKMVEEISLLTRDVMDFRKTIRPQRDLFAEPPQHPLVTADNAQRWQVVHRHIGKVWEALENVYERVEHLANTNSTMLQHKENEILRLLTLFSIILVPAWMFITPFTPYARATSGPTALIYWTVLVLLVIVLLILLLRFHRKRVL